MKKQTHRRLRTGRSILRATPNPASTPEASQFLATLKASGYRGEALKERAEQERQRLAEKRLQRIQNLAISRA